MNMSCLERKRLRESRHKMANEKTIGLSGVCLQQQHTTTSSKAAQLQNRRHWPNWLAERSPLSPWWPAKLWCLQCLILYCWAVLCYPQQKGRCNAKCAEPATQHSSGFLLTSLIRNPWISGLLPFHVQPSHKVLMPQFEVWYSNLKAVSLEELVPCTIAPENNKPTSMEILSDSTKKLPRVVIFVNPSKPATFSNLLAFLVTCFTVGTSERCSEEALSENRT